MVSIRGVIIMAPTVSCNIFPSYTFHITQKNYFLSICSLLTIKQEKKGIANDEKVTAAEYI